MPLLSVLLLACALRSAGAPFIPGGGVDVAAGLPRELVGELAIEGSLPQRLSKTPADLVVLYGGEHKGSLETCGCPKRPRGSLSRLVAYADAVRARAPTVLVHGGHWLEDATDFDGHVRADILVQDRTMVAGLEAAGFDAVNVTAPDLAGLLALPEGAGDTLHLVSANVRGASVVTHRVFEIGGISVGVTGIAGPTSTLAALPDGAVLDPVAAATPVLERLVQQADVVVLLAYQTPDAARALRKRFPGIDVVVDTGGHREHLAPVRVDDTAWVYSHYQTLRLGELRLGLRDGRIVGGVDRHVDLDPEMPDAPSVLALQRAARAEIDAVQQQIFGE